MVIESSDLIEVVVITEQDWRQLRDLRLQALADTPHAFMETLLHAMQQTDEDWQARARRCEGPDYVGFAAIAGDPGARGARAGVRRWVGTMRGELSTAGEAWLLGVFVAPSHRGRALKVADSLLDRIEEWAAGRGCAELLLDVHEANEHAQAFYRRRGYVFTGDRQPYLLGDNEYELRMRRPLGS